MSTSIMKSVSEEVTAAKTDSEVDDLLFRGFVHPYRPKPCCVLTKKRVIVVVVVILVLVLYAVALGLGIGLGLRASRPDNATKSEVIGAVAADHEACSDVGRDILSRGGSAVDAAIAALMCNGLRQPHSMGVGGGCFMVIYEKKTRKVVIIDGRETAPAASSPEMFVNASGNNGAKFIGVPGELPAYWRAHQMFGHLPWKDLFEPTIRMAEDGHPLSYATARAFRLTVPNLQQLPGLCDLFCRENGEAPKEGDIVKMPRFAKTLRGIAEVGPDYLSDSEITDEIISEIQRAGGVLSKEDLQNYTVRLESPMEFDIGNMTLFTHTAPSGGPVLGLILNILEGFNLTSNDVATTEQEAATYHKIVEAFKLAYADRLGLGDPAYNDLHVLLKKMKSEDYAAYLQSMVDTERTHNTSYYTDVTGSFVEEHGTTHLSVLGPTGDAVSVTSTINSYFGGKFASQSTGIIWNNEMADFSLPRENNLENLKATQLNSVVPGKRPLSSMAPAIVTDKKGDALLVFGSAGGSRITTVNAMIAVRVLWLGESLEDAVRKLRFHHQLFPNKLFYEEGLSQSILSNLYAKGHNMEQYRNYIGVVQAILRDRSTGKISAYADNRKRGKASLLYG